MTLPGIRIQSALLLMSFTSYGIAQVGGQTCCNLQPPCKNLTTLNLTIKQFVSRSPFYQPIYSSPTSSTQASACHTYFPINNSTYLQFITVIDLDGSLAVKVFITADLYPGVFRVQGLYGSLGNDSAVHNNYLLDATACASCQPIYMSYRDFLLDSCEYVNSKYDSVFGLSPSVENAPSCLKRFKNLVRAIGLQVNGFTKASGQPQCVVYFNNATCINGENVNPKFAITYPQDVPSAGCYRS